MRWSPPRASYYRVDHARIYNLPETPPEIYVSGFGPKATDLAARIGDGYINTAPDDELLSVFKEKAAASRPRRAPRWPTPPRPEEGWEHAHRLWPNAGLPGEMAQVLPTPEHFEQATELVTDGSRPGSRSWPATIPPSTSTRSGSTPTPGYDELYVANMGPHFAEMISFYGDQVIPEVRG